MRRLQMTETIGFGYLPAVVIMVMLNIGLPSLEHHIIILQQHWGMLTHARI
jgi:hypothetical protein